MNKPRIFLGSSGKQARLLQALTRGLEDVAQVEPWTTSFNPGTSTLERLLELTQEVDFAAFVFARRRLDDGRARGITRPRTPARPLRATTSCSKPASSAACSACAEPSSSTRVPPSSRVTSLGSPASGTAMRRRPPKCAPSMTSFGRRSRTRVGPRRIEGLWWQFSLTERSAQEPSAVSLLRVSRDRDGALALAGRSWQEDGRLSARYWSEAAKEKNESSGLFYYWNGERPLDANAPQLYGTGEIRVEAPDRASGYFTTRADTQSSREHADRWRILARRAGGPGHPRRPRR